MKLEVAKEKLYEINRKIESLKQRSFFIQEVECDYENKNEKFEANLAMQMVDKLEDVAHLYELMMKEVLFEGRLVLNERERYEVDGTDYYYTSGSPIIFYDEKYEEWVKATVEHGGDDYYITNYRNTPMKNLLVQVR